MNYHCWNEAIFNHFFNETVSKKEVLFCVDDDVLLQIGEKWAIDKARIIDNFCQCVCKQIIYPIKDKNIIKLNQIELKIKDNIPSQTAIIAFLILAASKMGKDKDISARNYYSHLKTLSDKFYDKPIQKGFRACDKDKYFEIFNSFEKYVNEDLNGKLGKIHFKGLFQKEKRTSADWIGIPIFQSMISRKDKALLTQEFANAKGGKISVNDIVAINKFSHVFKTLYFDNKYKQLLENKINILYKNWDGCIYEIDENNREYCIIYPKILFLKRRFGEYNFFEAIKYNKKLSEFDFNNKHYTKSQDFDNYYTFPLEINDINLDNKEFIINDKYKIKYPERDFILFKKSEEFGGYYIETNYAQIGDNISIIGTPSFFEQNIKLINSITDKNVVLDCIDENLSCAKQIKVLKEELRLNIKAQDKIILKKGLKIGHKYEYLKGAEPILFFSNNNDENIRFSIDKNPMEFSFSKGKVDLRERNNSPGLHYIETINNNSLNYSIVEQIKEQDETFIGYIVDDDSINKTKEFKKETLNLVNGCYIYNFSPKKNKDLSANKEKTRLIINAIDKKNLQRKFIAPKQYACKNFYNTGLINNVGLKYMQLLQEKEDNVVS